MSLDLDKLTFYNIFIGSGDLNFVSKTCRHTTFHGLVMAQQNLPALLDGPQEKWLVFQSEFSWNKFPDQDLQVFLYTWDYNRSILVSHDDVIKWKHFPHYWPFVRGIHRSPVNSPHKGQWRGVLMFSLICAWANCWANHRDAGDLRRHLTHYDVTVLSYVSGAFPS